MYAHLVWCACGSDLCVLRRWGSITVDWRWGDVWIGGRIGQKWKENSPWVFLKLDDRTTVKDRRWGELGMTGVGRIRHLVRGWIAVGSLTRLAFGSWLDWRLVCSLDLRLVRGSFFLSLALSFGSLSSFFLWLSLSFAHGRKWFEGKMNL